MNGTCLTLFAIFFLSSAACAQDQPGSRHRHLDSGYSAISHENFDVGTPGEPAHGRIIQIAPNCGPDRAEAVWGAGSSLLGYSCVVQGANG
jgi:hypothetical protein